MTKNDNLFRDNFNAARRFLTSGLAFHDSSEGTTFHTFHKLNNLFFFIALNSFPKQVPGNL